MGAGQSVRFRRQRCQGSEMPPRRVLASGAGASPDFSASPSPRSWWPLRPDGRPSMLRSGGSSPPAGGARLLAPARAPAMVLSPEDPERVMVKNMDRKSRKRRFPCNGAGLSPVAGANLSPRLCKVSPRLCKIAATNNRLKIQSRYAFTPVLARKGCHLACARASPRLCSRLPAIPAGASFG